jgi:hypothetical protein
VWYLRIVPTVGYLRIVPSVWYILLFIIFIPTIYNLSFSKRTLIKYTYVKNWLLGLCLESKHHFTMYLFLMMVKHKSGANFPHS